MKIQDVLWVTTAKGECIGIVYGEDEVTNVRKAYIGIGGGDNETEDVESIASLGGKILFEDLEKIADYLKSKD